jgi:hypothetical protein
MKCKTTGYVCFGEKNLYGEEMQKFVKNCLNCGLRLNCNKQGNTINNICNNWVVLESLDYFYELKEYSLKGAENEEK